MMRIETPWGPWEAAPLDEVVALMRGLAAPWWVAGGYAIELAVGRPYREHEDVDIALLRRDQLAVRRLLHDWDVHAAVVPRTLRPWALEEVLPESAHDIWVREHPEGPWRFQLMLDEADGEEWVYRRDPRIRRPLAGLTVEEDGFHRLAPEVQLLYKAKGRRPKDETDFEKALPLLSDGQRRWLDEALEMEHTTHSWRERLRRDP
ncbi:amino acid transporter [Spongiactinospora gelatinilytica]|uniref:Amino acid transporter n=1 Tax=Spongiactinospora gelatinilytica TaxID=2666298 RepID=A0A2W2IQN2_9ACTN|nr:amino acid transporter [Spongiactinospora gelatinilytica]PZG52084.1 amino acid transporter [Spongiactinospora gelatinilytica]